MTFSNDDIDELRTRLLAYTRSDQTPMAGRRRERAWLEGALKEPAVRIVRLWAPLGSGKTTLLNNVLKADAGLDLDEGVDVHKTTVVGLDAKALEFEPRVGRVRTVLAVEEFDRKLSFDRMTTVARAAMEWLDTTSEPAPLLLLTGDQFLMHPFFDELIAERPAAFDTLDELTVDLLADALALRIDKLHFHRLTSEPSEEAGAIAREILADPDLVLGLLPPTERSVGAFRDALSTLNAMAERGLPPRSDHVEVPPPRERSDRSVRGLMRELLDAVLDQIKQLDQFPAMSLAELAALAHAEGGSGDDQDYEDLHYFLDEAVAPLVNGGFLTPHGIAYFPSDGGRIGGNCQGPFSPSPKTYRLHVALARA